MRRFQSISYRRGRGAGGDAVIGQALAASISCRVLRLDGLPAPPSARRQGAWRHWDGYLRRHVGLAGDLPWHLLPRSDLPDLLQELYRLERWADLEAEAAGRARQIWLPHVRAGSPCPGPSPLH